MKKIFNLLLLGLTAMSFFACKVENPEIIDTTGSTGITSVAAKFNSGPLASDPNAIFTATVSDPNVTEIIIPIPAFYPKESDNEIKPEDLKMMRVQAKLENGVSMRPALGLLDLNQDNHVEVSLPSGAILKYIIKGRVEKLKDCFLEALSLTDADGEAFECIIDNEKKTITAMSISKTELKDCKAVYRISPHAAISSPKMEQPKTWKPGDKLTVVAHDGVSKTEYSFTIAIPEKVEYGIRLGSEINKWTKYYKTDYGITLEKPITRLAVLGDYLLVSTGKGICAVNKATGIKVKDIELPAGTVVHSLANIYGCTIGNMRVRGDVTKNAVITVVAGAPPPRWYIAWEIKDGTPTTVVDGIAKGIFGKTAGSAAFWNPQQGCAMPAGDSFADGMFYTGYDGTRKVFYTPTIIKNAPWTKVIETGNEGNENLNCLATATFNKAKYVTYLMGAHFGYGNSPTIKMFDYSNPDAIEDAKVFEMGKPDNLGGFKGVGASSDIALSVSSDGYKMSLYWTDGNYDVIGCYEFDCIKK